MTLDPGIRGLIPAVSSQAQYEVLRRLAGKSLKPNEVSWTNQFFQRFELIEQSVAFTWHMGDVNLSYSADFDPRMIESIFNIGSRDQLALYMEAESRIPMTADHYFRSEVIPRVSNSFQRDSLRILMQHPMRSLENDLMNLALLVDSREKQLGFEYALDQGASFLDARALLSIRSAEDLRAFRRAIDAVTPDFDSILASSEKIAANKRTDFWVSISGYSIVGNEPISRPLFVRMSDRAKSGGEFFPRTDRQSFMATPSEDRWVRENQQVNEYLRQKEPSAFVYSVFNREVKRRGKFESDFISYLKDEDRILPFERLQLFEFRNTDQEIIGVFGLFDATPLAGYTDDTLPALRKRPHISTGFQSKAAEWRAELGGRTPRVFEVRRLALHPKASQLDVETVIRTIQARLKSLGIEEESYIIAHTDRSGSAIFQRKAKMHLLFTPEDLKRAKGSEAPDEYILYARVATDWREI